MDKKISVQKNMLFNTVGTVYYLACQWLTTILVVNIGNLNSAGYLSLAISISNVFVTIAFFGMRNYQVSDINDKYSSSLYVTSRIATSLASLVLCILFATLNGGYNREQVLCILLYMAFRVSEALVDVFQGIQQKAYRMDYVAVSLVVRGTLSLSIFYVVLKFTGNLVAAIGLMALATTLIVILYDLRICNKIARYRKDFTIKQLYELLLKCFPLMVTVAMITSVVSIPRYYLERLYNREILGIYATIATPAVIVQAAFQMLYTPLTTVFAENYNDKNYKRYMEYFIKVTSVMLFLSIVSVIGSHYLGRYVLSILFDEWVNDYVYLFTPAIVTTMAIGFIYYFTMILTVSRRIKEIVMANASSVVLVGVVSPGMIRKYGMNGVNYSLFIATGVNFLILAFSIWWDVRSHFKERST